MRLVPINSVKEGSFLAKTLFDNDGRILLRDGVRLTENLIKRIKNIGTDRKVFAVSPDTIII